jgi:nucleoside triphosphate pyrophosphatase
VKLAIVDTPIIYMASQSPRRAELLRQLGVRFQVVTVHVDETAGSSEEPAACVQRLAEAKAHAALNSLGSGITQPILAADTLVSIDGTILGKPADRSEALTMLARLSDRWHQVLSAVTLWYDGVTHGALSVSAVKFRAITAEEAINYWQSGEPMDKAGGYAIQGRAALFVERIEGSYSGVMGLPLFETAALLRAAGLRIL